ncbi:hypothetical protein D9M68_985290 [compost metagenome]
MILFVVTYGEDRRSIEDNLTQAKDSAIGRLVKGPFGFHDFYRLSSDAPKESVCNDKSGHAFA